MSFLSKPGKFQPDLQFVKINSYKIVKIVVTKFNIKRHIVELLIFYIFMMKKILIIGVLTSLLLISCIMTDSRHTVKGSGNVSKENRQVSPFSKVAIEGVFTVYISQGDIESVEVEIDDNYQQYVEVETIDNKLVLKTLEKKDLRNPEKSNIYLTVKEIDMLYVMGVCRFNSVTPLNFETFKFKVDGVCNGDLEVNCSNFDAQINGVSNIKLTGKAEEFLLDHSGVGSFDAGSFEAKKVNVSNSGVGKVSVFATEELSMDNSGIGVITHSGNAKIISAETSKIGKIKKVVIND